MSWANSPSYKSPYRRPWVIPATCGGDVFRKAGYRHCGVADPPLKPHLVFVEEHNGSEVASRKFVDPEAFAAFVMRNLPASLLPAGNGTTTLVLGQLHGLSYCEQVRLFPCAAWC